MSQKQVMPKSEDLSRSLEKNAIWTFDGLKDRLENRMENRAMGAHNRTIVCDFEESDGIGWSRLTCQTRSDGSHTIIYLYRCARCIIGKYNKNLMRTVGQWEQKITWNLSKHESHQITLVNSNVIKILKIGQWDADFR